MEDQEVVSIAKSGASHADKVAAILRHMDQEEAEEFQEGGA